MNAIPSSILDELRAVVGPKGWLSDPADTEPHLVEWRDLYRGVTPLVLKPASTEEVSRILAICNRSGTKIVPQGGNTGLVGGGIPFMGNDEVVLSLKRMNAVRAIDTGNDTITVEAGCVLADIQRIARENGKLYPMSIGSEGSCQIGGNLSTNAGGVAVLRYGNSRDLVLGIEAVLADGRVMSSLRGLRKDNTGYDLKQLFIGSEGTLGIITAAVLKLYPLPRSTQTAIAAVPNPSASVALLGLARERSGGQVSGFEIMPRIGFDFVLRHVPNSHDPLAKPYPWYVLIELTSGGDEAQLRETMEALLADGLDKGLVDDAVIAQSDAQRNAFWRIRETMSEAQKPEGGSIKCDVSVPVSKMPAFIDEASAKLSQLCPGIRHVTFGHIGDGNVHFNASQPIGTDKAAFLARWDELTEAVYDIVHAYGGSISAEHGVGRMKIHELPRYKSAVELDVMRTLKRSLDPNNILNPGKVVEV